MEETFGAAETTDGLRIGATLLVTLLLCDVLLIGAFVAVTALPPSHTQEVAAYLLDPNGETNVPTWYASSKLLVCAILLATLSFFGNIKSIAPSLLFVLLLLLSLDEAAMLHELLGRELSRIFFGTADPHKWPWLVGLPAAVLLAIAIWFWLRERTVSAVSGLRVSIGLALLVTAAVGGDLVGQNVSWPVLHIWVGPAPLVTLVEELLENLAVSVLLWAILGMTLERRDAIATAISRSRL